jgi:hypothetical protein
MTRITPFVFAAWFVVGCGTPETVELVREPTPAEVDAVCSAEDAAKDELSAAQWRVGELEREVAVSEGKVKELEARLSSGAGGQLRQELERYRALVTETKAELAIAEAEKEQLLVALADTRAELGETKVVLARTKEQRDEAREDALYNRWQKFVATAQLEICDKGNRRKLGGCREAVTAALATTARQAQFAHCIRSDQAMPLVHELEKAATLPQYAQMMDEESKQVKGWYVEYCDPTLPEKVDAPLAEQHLPNPTNTQG